MKIVYKVIKDGKIEGIIVRHNNRYTTVLKPDIAKYNYTNATITADLKIKSKSGKYIPEVDTKNVLKLYHGSKFGLTRIDVNGCVRASDFGKGFYMNNSKENAEELIARFQSGKMYSFLLVMDSLNVYRFKNQRLWGYFISYNRAELGLEDIPKEYRDSIVDISTNYDVIVGAIADDSMSEAYRMYSTGLISDLELFNCIVCLGLGQQFLVRTEKALRNLLLLDSYTMSEDIRKCRLISLANKRLMLSRKLKDLMCRKGIKYNGKNK